MRKYKVKRVIRRSTSMYGISENEVQMFLKQEYELHVHSSNVESARYFPSVKELVITFKQGKTREYTYLNVGPSMVENFIAAPSKGEWVSKTLVRTKWPFRKG